MEITFSQFTSTGLVRKNNQDSLLSVKNGEFGLFAVADGMGGHFGGEIASGRLIEALSKWWDNFITAPIEFDKCVDVIKTIITEVNDSIYNEFSKNGKICGTTIALILIYSNKYLLINAGDSRVYCMKKRKIVQESVDHVFSAEAKISGKLTDEEINSHKNKNKLTSAVGCKETFKMNVKTAPLDNCAFFICSDGVYKYCNEKNIRRFLLCNDTTKLEKNVQNVVDGNGANDNYSYIKIICEKGTPFSYPYLCCFAICSAILLSSLLTIFLSNRSANSHDIQEKEKESTTVVIYSSETKITQDTSKVEPVDYISTTKSVVTTFAEPQYTGSEIIVEETNNTETIVCEIKDELEFPVQISSSESNGETISDISDSIQQNHSSKTSEVSESETHFDNETATTETTVQEEITSANENSDPFEAVANVS